MYPFTHFCQNIAVIPLIPKESKKQQIKQNKDEEESDHVKEITQVRFSIPFPCFGTMGSFAWLIYLYYYLPE